jgi:hypothetical protein
MNRGFGGSRLSSTAASKTTAIRKNLDAIRGATNHL